MSLHKKKIRGGENRYIILQVKNSISVTMATRDLQYTLSRPCQWNVKICTLEITYRPRETKFRVVYKLSRVYKSSRFTFKDETNFMSRLTNTLKNKYKLSESFNQSPRFAFYEGLFSFQLLDLITQYLCTCTTTNSAI